MPIADIIHDIMFALLALVTLVGAIKVTSSRSIMHAAFWLFPVFAGIAGFYLLLDAQFLAAIQVLIYIGAILVLIIFAVTLTRNAADPDEAQNNRFVFPMILSALALLATVISAVVRTPWGRNITDISGIMLLPGVPITDISALGIVLLQQYLLPFEIASVLLLAALIGAIVLARRERPEPPASVAAVTADEPAAKPCETAKA